MSPDSALYCPLSGNGPIYCTAASHIDKEVFTLILEISTFKALKMSCRSVWAHQPLKCCCNIFRRSIIIMYSIGCFQPNEILQQISCFYKCSVRQLLGIIARLATKATFGPFWLLLADFWSFGTKFYFGSFSCFSIMYQTWKTGNVFKKENIKHTIFSFFSPKMSRFMHSSWVKFGNLGFLLV